MEQQDPVSNPQPSAKRRRIALACNACRIRKTRCNGAQPKCKFCENLGFDCQYEPSDSTTNVIVRKELVSGIEERLSFLEASVRRHEQLLRQGSSSYNTIDTSLNDGTSGGAQNTGQGFRTPSLNEHDNIQLEASGVQEIDAEGVSDGMAVTFLDEEDSGYFGSSSNISFMRHVFGAMSIVLNLQNPPTPATDPNLDRLDNGIINASRRLSPIPDPNPGSQNQLSPYTLPPEAELEVQLAAYFENTGFLFPFIHPPSFLETYKSVKDNRFTKVRRTWLGLLNIILAMATSTDYRNGASAIERTARSDVFYNRALTLCNTQMLRGTNIEIVQYLLLMSQYLQGTQKSVQTWIVHGLAVKAALSLGLQSESANSRFSPIEQEVRRRTWYGCVMLDRSQCLTFGRPSSIPDSYVRITLPTQWVEENLATATLQEESLVSTLFFKASIELYKVLSDVLGQLYDNNLDCGPVMNEVDLAMRVFNLEQDLNRWQMFLDPRLTLQTLESLRPLEDESLLKVTRCRTILTIRYHHLEVLLHRPFLVKSLDLLVKKTSQVQLPASVTNMAANSIKTCVTSAETSITMVYRILTQPGLGKHMLGAWWFTLFYVFNAAITIFGSFLIEMSAVEAPLDLEDRIARARQNLTNATSALIALDWNNRTVTKCKEYVEYLISMLDQCVVFRSRGMDNNPGSGNPPWQQLMDFLTSDIHYFDNAAALAGGETDFNRLLSGDLELGQFFISGGA
ncbi:hypothetical protein KCU91_g1929, partial [Aureobasidium melanogenum]